jgi:hypothetical protein
MLKESRDLGHRTLAPQAAKPEMRGFGMARRTAAGQPILISSQNPNPGLREPKPVIYRVVVPTIPDHGVA